MLKISEYTGDIQSANLTMLGNIKLDLAADPSYKGRVLSIADDGLLTLRNIPDQDTHYQITRVDEYTLSAWPEEILSVTIPEDIAQSLGSIDFACKISNSVNQLGYITFTVKVNGVLVSENTITIQPNEAEKVIVQAGPFVVDRLTNDVFTLEVYHNGGALVMNGATFPSSLTVTKAAVPVVAATTVTPVVWPLSAIPSKAQLEAAAVSAIPDFDTDKEYTFFVLDDPQGTFYLVKYFDGDFYYEKLTKAN